MQGQLLPSACRSSACHLPLFSFQRPIQKHHPQVFTGHQCYQACPKRCNSVKVVKVDRESSPIWIHSVPESEKSIWRRILEFSGKLLAVVVAGCALALASGNACEAARSGGRMGGRAFSTSKSSSFSSPFSSSQKSFSGSSSPWGSSQSHMRGSRSVGVNAFFFPTFGYGYGMGGGFFSILFYGFLFTALIQIVQSMIGDNEDNEDGMTGGSRIAVARVQVGLLGLARGLQKDLDRVARAADTSTPDGLHFVLEETILALNRNPDYCVYGFAQCKTTTNAAAAESKFNELSLQERSKIQQETLSNVGGRSGGSQLRGSAADGSNELIVVTILVAAEANLKLPKISSLGDLQTALNRLGSVRSQQVMAVEVLWVPQDERDSYTRDELLQEYPNMYTL